MSNVCPGIAAGAFGGRASWPAVLTWILGPICPACVGHPGVFFSYNCNSGRAVYDVQLHAISLSPACI